MTFKVAALYAFTPLPDLRELQQPVAAMCCGLGIKGTLLLAPEGLNGTLAGTPDAIDTMLARLEAMLGDRLDGVELKFSTAAEMPFKRLKVRLKKEIVTLGAPEADPNVQVGTYVMPEDWNALIADPDVLVLDTRNGFEVEMGTFERAVDPKIERFGQFKDFVAGQLDAARHRKVAMFCTGGIRCEKASSYMLAHGVAEVFHLKGGILSYLEKIPEADSLWRGDCFVFDERVALGHGLVERPGSIRPDVAARLAASLTDDTDAPPAGAEGNSKDQP